MARSGIKLAQNYNPIMFELHFPNCGTCCHGRPNVTFRYFKMEIGTKFGAYCANNIKLAINYGPTLDPYFHPGGLATWTCKQGEFICLFLLTYDCFFRFRWTFVFVILNMRIHTFTCIRITDYYKIILVYVFITMNYSFAGPFQTAEKTSSSSTSRTTAPETRRTWRPHKPSKSWCIQSSQPK